MTQHGRLLCKIIVIGKLLSMALHVDAQDWKTEKKVNVLFGLVQPIFGKGFNIEGNYIDHRLIVDYSHGASLDFSGNRLPSDLKRQQLVIHEPWTTGFGVGYRLREWVNVRVEPKWHRFEYYYEGAGQQKQQQVIGYNTFTLGLGVYGAYQPFKHQQNALRGLVIAPSIRYWPTVHSGLGNDGYHYQNTKTGQAETIKTLDAGTGFTPFVINVSIGYSFSLKKKV